MSLSNPIYGTLPAFQERSASRGPTFNGGGGGGGEFIPPPPGASVGGEPGHYPSLQQSNPSPFNWPNPLSSQTQFGPQASAYSPWGSGYAQSHQSQHSQPASFQPQPLNHYSPYQPAPTQHSPYHHPSQNSPYQPHALQRPSVSEPGSAWTYAQYPPSPEYPPTAPIPTFNHTLNASGRRSPYGTHIPQPPPSSAPAEAPPWAHLMHSQQHSNHSQTHPHRHHEHTSSHTHRPTHQRHHSNGSPGYLPYSDEQHSHVAVPLPFRGSANAPAPKKSAMRRSNSQSAPGRHAASGSRSQPHTPRIQRASLNDTTNETGFGFAYNNGSVSGWPQMAVSPATYPTMAPPTSAPAAVIPPNTTQNVPGYTLADEHNWTSDHLSPRPRDWRADYSPRQGFSTYIPRIGRARSDVEEYIDTVKRDLHPLLYHAPNAEPLTFDLRYPIVHGQTLLISQSQRNFNEVDLAQHAAFPPAPMLRLYNPKFPWYVDVHQSHPGGVTVFDVLAQLSVQSQAQIRSRHYYNDVLESADRTTLGRTYKERCKGRSGDSARGILQVDFLGDKYVFEGLARGKQGMWEIKMRRVGDPPLR